MLVPDFIKAHTYIGASGALIPVSVFQTHMKTCTEMLRPEEGL